MKASWSTMRNEVRGAIDPLPVDGGLSPLTRAGAPRGRFLSNWNGLTRNPLKKRQILFFGSTAWPQHRLEEET